MAYGVTGLIRSCERISATRQCGPGATTSFTKIRALDELYLPKVVEQICDLPRA